MNHRRLFPLLVFCAAQVALTESEIRFSRDIRPILSKNCFQCHGPDGKERKAGLRLDQAEGDEGVYRTRRGSTAIRPGNLDESALWRRINSHDPDEVMPPPEAKLGRLSEGELLQIKEWILSGAEFEAYWAFVPPRPKPLPPAGDSDWSQNPVDRFVAQRHRRENLEPMASASKRTLIRRLSFDLTGLPPSLKEIQRFLADPTEQAYEDLVERLLAKPQFGEHMAKYWLDLVRFADTNGLHHDHYREMTPYRDWVIRAFNTNLPFDEFTAYQIAGDLYEKPTVDQQIASGFNRLHLIIDRGTALPEESFTRNVVDRVTAVGTAFLGLTVQCAVCHDHKYDPITQKDFYQLFAFFNNFDGGPETGGRNGTDFKRGLQPPYLEFPSDAQRRQRASLEEAIESLETELTALEDSETDSKEGHLKSLKERLNHRKSKHTALVETIPATLVMRERQEIRPAHILVRGVYDQKGPEVDRDTPEFLPPLEPQGEIPSRMDLAKWLIAPSNPLPARVAVNRFWQQFFGVGLVKTSEDFGVQGELPSHPELLDYLALEFQRTGWDVKQLIRTLVGSQTYQQSSKASPEAYAADPENRLLSRGSRFRLDSEMIRDQILSVSGQLNHTLYGRSVKPPQPSGLWSIVAMPSSYPKTYQTDSGDQILRRSIYTFWKRALPPPQMTIFDAPTREACIARRERTNTPLQALLMMNETHYFRAAAEAAARVRRGAGLSEDERIRHAHELVTSQLPSPSALDILRSSLGEFKTLYAEHPAEAKALATPLLGQSADSKESVELAAWTLLIHSLLNLDITKTRQ